MVETAGNRKQLFRFGNTGPDLINSRRAACLGDVNQGLVFVEEVAIEIDGSTAGEAAFRSVVDEIGIEIERKEVEAVVRSANCGEGNGSSGFHWRWGASVSVGGDGCLI